ncbi:hypothetical protein EV361DRAFT_952706 [Lentinula raphanica]|nr:hypothetical protein EV361DRAFT_952706 [Lentinula raphanica]
MDPSWAFEDIEPAHFGNIPPPSGARYEGGEGLNMSAFPGIADGGGRVMPGATHPRLPAPPGWDYQAPPHTAPGAFYHPNLPHPSQMQTPYVNTALPWAHSRDQRPPASGHRTDGFSSLAWRPPEYDPDPPLAYESGGGFGNEYNRRPPPVSAPPAGQGFGAETSGGYFANAGRRGHGTPYPRQRSISRSGWDERNDGWDANRSGWGPRDDEPEWGEEEDEEEQMRRARAELAQRGQHGFEDEEDTDWALVDSFARMGVADGNHHHRDRGRSRSRSRHHSRHPADASRHHKSSRQRAASVGEAWPTMDPRMEQHRSRERMERTAWHNQGTPFTTNNRLLENNVYNPDDRVGRPRDWRADYSVKPNPNILTRLSSTRQRNYSSVVEMNDPVKRVANALLNRVHSSRPPLLIDLRFPIQTQLQLYADQRTHSGYGGGIFPYLGRPPANIDFAQMACEPPAPHMRFYHPRLPWYIDLMSASYMQSRGGVPGTPGYGVGYGVVGLTVWEVIEGVWRELQKPITSRDFYNEEMGTVMSGGRNRSTSLTTPSPYMPPTPLSTHSALPSPGYPSGYDMYGQPQPPQTARDLVTIAFRSRCKAVGQEIYGDSKRGKLDYSHIGPGEAGETSKGVRRVDWLGMDGEWIWTGIVRNRSGMWEIKTRKI